MTTQARHSTMNAVPSYPTTTSESVENSPLQRANTSILMSPKATTVLTKGTRVIFQKQHSAYQRPPVSTASSLASSYEWFDGRVLGLSGPEDVLVECATDFSQHHIPEASLLRYPLVSKEVTDLLDLNETTEGQEGSLMFSLQQRYRSDLHYTRMTIGQQKLFISINPYKWIDYDLRKSPHPIQVAHEALEFIQQKMKEMVRESVSPPALGGNSPQSPTTAAHTVRPSHVTPQDVASGKEDDLVVSVVLTGQSGAGKTECAKMIMREFCKQQSSSTPGGVHSNTVLDRLQDVHPILELFGNAATNLNANSSRFVKYITVEMDSSKSDGAAVVQSAQVSSYLLEVSRLVKRNPGESNFHIFYALLDGLTSQERKEFDLWDAALFKAVEDQKATSPSSTSSFSSSSSNNMPFTLDDLRKSFSTIGLQAQDQKQIWQVLAAILHLLNIQLTATDAHSAPVIANKQGPLTKAASLLGMSSADELETLLTSVTVTIAGRKETKKLNKATAMSYRDSLCKLLYEMLFDFLIGCINDGGVETLRRSSSSSTNSNEQTKANSKKLSGGNSTTKFCILDIFGFENLQTVAQTQRVLRLSGASSPMSPSSPLNPIDALQNDFEQLLINYTNEEVQSLYDQLVNENFEMEATVEGIDSAVLMQAQQQTNSPHKKRDNNKANAEEIALGTNSSHHYMEAMTRKPNGVLNIITDESTLGLQQHNPQLATTNLVDKITSLHQLYPDTVKKCKTKPTCFLLQHYCGSVEYTASHFTSKNRISTTGAMTIATACSGNDFLQTVIQFAKRHKQHQGHTYSQATLFREQLQQLMGLLRESQQVYWVRCIKPNHIRSPSFFQQEFVLHQLKTEGLVSTFQLLHGGYSVRLPHQQFAMKVLPILPQKQRDELLEQCKFKELCFLASNEIPFLRGGGWRPMLVGISKVFLQRHLLRQVEECVSRALSKHARYIQCFGRGFLIRLACCISLHRKKKLEKIQLIQNRIESERGKREHLEKQRYAVFQADATARNQALQVTKKGIELQAPPFLKKYETTVKTMNQELHRSFTEIFSYERSRAECELKIQEQDKYKQKFRHQYEEQKAKEAEIKHHSIKMRDRILGDRVRTVSRAEKSKKALLEHDQAMRNLVSDARNAQIEEQKQHENEELLRQKRIAELREMRSLKQHIAKSQKRLNEELTVLAEREWRDGVTQEVLQELELHRGKVAVATAQAQDGYQSHRRSARGGISGHGRLHSEERESPSALSFDGRSMSATTTTSSIGTNKSQQKAAEELQWHARKELWAMWESTRQY